MTPNLYRVVIRNDEAPDWPDEFFVLAPAAKVAVAKGFRKCERRNPGWSRHMTLLQLELVEEDFV